MVEQRWRVCSLLQSGDCLSVCSELCFQSDAVCKECGSTVCGKTLACAFSETQSDKSGAVSRRGFHIFIDAPDRYSIYETFSGKCGRHAVSCSEKQDPLQLQYHSHGSNVLHADETENVSEMCFSLLIHFSSWVNIKEIICYIHM